VSDREYKEGLRIEIGERVPKDGRVSLNGVELPGVTAVEVVSEVGEATKYKVTLIPDVVEFVDDA